ncbi:MAG: hypothetical protein ACREJC_07580 [Tepidisphaeraceae bacterium]
MPTETEIATAADYVDALVTARRSKNLLVLVLLLIVLAQLGLFFAARFTGRVLPSGSTTQPSARLVDFLHYVVGLTDFLGVILTIVLALVLLLIVNIMLVGRLIGVGQTISAYVWCLVTLVLLFPWQAFMNNATFSATEFKIPGALYTWEELSHPVAGARFATTDLAVSVLKWARFVGFPALAALLLLVMQVKSNRALRQALGEAEVTRGDSIPVA